MGNSSDSASPAYRRAFLKAGMATAAAAMSSSVFAQPRGGSTVWLDYDQETLDKVYDQANYAPNRKLVLGRYETNSELTRQRLGTPKRYSYGDTDIEGFDLFAAEQDNAPIHLFIHGGTWRFGAADEYAFLADPFVEHGAHFIVADFTNVIDTKGDLAPLVDQVQRLVQWVYKNAESFGGDPEKIYISGHSSGGHLAGAAVTTDWKGKFDLPPDVIKGGVLVSGVFDLEPVSLSARSNYVTLDEAAIERFSPQRNIEHLQASLVIVYGDQETPEFMRQSRDFAEAAKKAGKSVKLVEGLGYNHFEIIETMANPYGVAGEPALELMGL